MVFWFEEAAERKTPKTQGLQTSRRRVRCDLFTGPGFLQFLKAKAQDVPPDTRLRPSVQSPLCFPLQSSLPPHPLLPFPCNSSFPSHSLSLKIWCVPPDTRLRPSVQSPVPFPLKSSFPLHPLSLKFGVPHPTLDNALPFEVLFPFHSSPASHSIP